MALLEFDPATDFGLLLAVLLIPLVGYVVQIFFGKKLPRQGDWLLTGGMFAVMCITVFLAFKIIASSSGGHGGDAHGADASQLWSSQEHGFAFHWLFSDAPGIQNVVAGILYDPLGAVMLAVVGIVCFCVHLFSIGYMHGDRRYHVFFANISLFSFAMLGLVLADNILFLFLFWEIMGLMSYLLIGHFSQDPSKPFFHRWATWASKKAFLTTRVGDCLLFIAIFIFYRNFTSLWSTVPEFKAALPNFQPFVFRDMWEMGRLVVEHNGGEFPGWMTAAGLCAFGGTVGKSAQFPLHIWLPDAMAGPTPVSAMIHAATMVAAGVFLLGRMYPLMSPEVLSVVTVVGATTAIFAATIGMVVYDIKAVLAYSTISQLGFMVAAVGLGGVVAGMFHMVTHAFFKACLFLSAGSVIHGCHHVQDMRIMGGVRKYMPVTFVCMLVCTAAIAGVPFFSGFYSKDMIILAGWAGVLDVRHFDGWKLYALLALALAAMLTAFYMFRLIFMTFFGEYRGNLERHMYSAALAAGGVEGPNPNEHAEPVVAHAVAGHGEHGHGAEPAHGHAHGHAHEAPGHGHATHGHGHAKAHAAPEHGHATPSHAHAAPAHAHATALHAAHGDDGHGHHGAHVPHESPPTMLVALCVLAFLGVFGGHFWLADPGHLLTFYKSEPWFTQVATPTSMYGAEVGAFAAEKISVGILDHTSDLGHAAHLRAVVLSLFVATVGIAGAWFLYVRRRDLPAVITERLGLAYTVVRRRYFVDEMVDVTFIQPTRKLCTVFRTIDERLIDGFVLLNGSLHRSLGFFWAWFDKTFVDGLVNWVGLVSQVFGAAVRLLQTGRIQQYAAFAVAGGLLAAAWLILA